jgi:transcriptional regulator with XRE-family HTH domain
MKAARTVRMGWLLRVNRVLGPDRNFATAARFAAALRAAGGGPASPARVSQWETGAARVSRRTVRRYERLLGLPVDRLAAVADVLAVPGDAAGPEPLDRERAWRLLERAPGDAPMSGSAWDELTVSLAGRPDVLIYPRDGWEQLTHRLLAEMVVADGPPWMRRNTALVRLLRHPSGCAATIAACAAFASDPAHQVFVEPLAALHVTAHPDAYRLVRAQLADPTSGRALCGALVAAIHKVERGQLAAPELAGLVRLAADLAGDRQVPDEVRHLVPVLLAHLPGEATGPAVVRLRRLAAADSVGRNVLGSGRTHATETTAAVVARVTLRAGSRLDLAEPDDVLPGLVEEMVFAPDPVTRLNSGFLIAATPYRTPVADAVAGELPDALRGDDARAAALLAALGALGTCPDRGALERLVLTAAVRPAVNEAAARALGLVPGRSVEAFWRAALHRHLTAWRRTGSSTTLTTLRRLVQALGVAGERRILAEVGQDPEVPATIRATATWWLGVDGTRRTSAAA